MGLANDKKVINQALNMLLVALGNTFISKREREHIQTNDRPYKRNKWIRKVNLNMPGGTVTAIETGGFLRLSQSQGEKYIAALTGNDNTERKESLKKVYDGLKEIDTFLGYL